MIFRKLAGLFSAFFISTGIAFAASDPWDLDVDIPYTLYKLDNGLTLIVHEDHKVPIVAVNIWYHVGSKDEKPGRTGFAHLFEHLMFNGSENYDHDYFEALEKVGATRLNGTTNWDRTNYFQNVPKSALDVVLWMESDRMGNLLGAITQEKLDEQRGVVQNEKRQNYDNAPYGEAGVIQYRNIYPSHHPYSWLPIGSMEDLDAATLEDVHAWFKKYYGAGNTVIVIAGDVDKETVHSKVKHYFGNIDAGPPLTKQQSWVAKLSGTHKQVSYDRVPQTMMMKSWNIEGSKTRNNNYLSMVGDVLTMGKNSRLYKRLVYDEQLVSSVNAYTTGGEIAGTFEITAMINPGVKEEVVDRIIEEELAKFLKEGPTRKELERVKVQTISGFIRGIEQIGGFGGKSDILASNYVYTGDPAYYKKELEWIQNASRDDLKDVANEWLSDGMYQLEIRPFPKYRTVDTDVDRSRLPEPDEPPLAEFDEFQRSTLDNGMSVIVARRDAIPVVQFQLSVNAGYASDQHSRAGVAKLAMNMLDEGTKRRDALEISDELILLGASIGTGSNLDTSFVSLSSLTTTLEDALDVFADVVLNPSFPAEELERLRTQQLTQIQREQLSPVSMALRVLPSLIYGEGHAYSNPMTGSGTLESVNNITLDELKQFHDTWFKPNNATMIVVGDTTMAEIMPLLEKAFDDWQPGEVPEKDIARVSKATQNSIFLVDRPDSEQSVLMAGNIAPPVSEGDEIAVGAMNSIIGGSFTSRINMNLREDKHWSYGASSGLFDARGQRTFYVYAGVQSDKTLESIQEVMQELGAFLGDEPVTGEELDKTIKNRALSLSGRWETAGAVLGTISEIVQYDLPDDYFDNYANKVRNLSTEDIDQAASQVIHPGAMTWVVVGDRASIEDELAKLGFGPVTLIDADGNVLED
ncbi:MAG: insulinase family protein [Pseudomonadales bacterium]|nr:insulinase family protein [Pseudomonadales bacterium]